jgi:type I restriction enzyme S subunit
MATSQDFVTWTCGDSLEPRFLMQALLAEGEDIRRFGEGSTHTTIYFPEVKAFHIDLPPKAEQRRIVSKIDSLSAKLKRARDRLDHVPRLVERYRQAVLAAAFQGDLTAKWREAQGLPRPATSALGDLITDIRYGTALKCHPAASGVAVLRIPNVSLGSINLSDLKYADLPARDYEKLRLREGDVLVIRSNGSADLVGRAALVSEEGVGMAYAGYLIRLRPDRSLLHPGFLTLMLGAPQVRAVIEVGARSTSGVHNINSVELASLVLPVPSLAEQGVAARMIETAFTWIDRLAKEATTARALIDRLDQAILAKAFRGELVPQDPADEPASVLLERIRAERAGAPAAERRGRPRAPALP